MVIGLEKFKYFFRGYEGCYVLIGGAASSCVRPFTARSTKPEGMKFRKNTSGQGILARSKSSIGSPPQLTPEGSIHIITAPSTAPIAMNRVNILRNVFEHKDNIGYMQPGCKGDGYAFHQRMMKRIPADRRPGPRPQ